MKALVFVFLLAAAIGCYPAKMALHADTWPSREEHKVEGRRGLFTKERMQFGEYRTTRVKRSWVKGVTSRFGTGNGNVTDNNYTNLISFDYIRRKQTVNFSLTDAAAQTSDVYCVSKFNTEELVLGNRPNSIFNIGIAAVQAMIAEPDSKYYVQIYTKEGEAPWELLLDNVQAQSAPKSCVGYLSKGRNDYYTIVPVRQMEDKNGRPASILFGTVGFEIRNKNGKAVAAVSLLNKGVIYFQSTDAEERFLLANVCAALLMQDEIG